MNAINAFLTRTRAERRALQIVNGAATWPRLHGVTEPARRTWMSALGLARIPSEVYALTEALAELQRAARLDVDRSQFVDAGRHLSTASIADAIQAVEAAVHCASRAWGRDHRTESVGASG